MKRFIITLTVLALLLFVAVKIALNYVVSEDFIIARIEENLNSRVAVESVDLRLLSVPTMLEVKGFQMSQRDGLVEAGVAASERPPMADSEVSCERFVCEISLRALLDNKLKINRVLIDQAYVRMQMYEDGSNSLDSLFHPAPSHEELVPKAQPVGEPDVSKIEPKSESVVKVAEPTSAHLITNLDEFRIRNLHFECELEQSGIVIVGDKLNVSIDDIRVDPNNLEQVNEVNAALSTTLKVVGKAGLDDPVVKLMLEGDTKARVFNPETGEIDPVVKFDIELDEQSFLSTHVPAVQQAWGALKALERFGLKVGVLPDYLRFGKSRRIKGQYAKGRAQLDDDVSLLVSDWELGLNAPAWLHLANSQHEMVGEFLVSQQATEKFLTKVERLTHGASQNGHNLMRQAIESDLVENGRLKLDLKSQGSLEQPKVRLMTEIPRVEDQVKEQVKKKAMDFLRSKFGK